MAVEDAANGAPEALVWRRRRHYGAVALLLLLLLLLLTMKVGGEAPDGNVFDITDNDDDD